MKISLKRRRDLLWILLMPAIYALVVGVLGVREAYDARFNPRTPAQESAAAEARVSAIVATAQADAETARAAEARAAAIANLEKDLRNRGYDLTVKQSNTANEIAIASSDFSDTDHRVRFLSFIRGRNSPAVPACLAGFTTVRLSSFELFSLVSVSMRVIRWNASKSGLVSRLRTRRRRVLVNTCCSLHAGESRLKNWLISFRLNAPMEAPRRKAR
jgi:hypothetical protein